MGLGDRLRDLAGGMERGWQAELARHSGVKPPSVADWLNGSTKSLDGENLLRTAEFFTTRLQRQVNPMWIASGKGMKFLPAQPELFLVGEQLPTPAPSAAPIPYDGGALATIRQYDTGGAMGTGLVLRDQPGVIRSFSVSREWIEKNLPYYTSIENLAIVTGFGDSMLGLFNPGDPLIVDRGITKADVDGVYFFRVGDEGFIKRLQRIPGEGILVISENAKYRDWTIKETMDFEVMAKVLRAWKGQNL